MQDKFYQNAGRKRADKPEFAWLEDPEVFAVNRLPAHSDHKFYTSEADCRTKNNALKQTLNGAWRFRWSKTPAERPQSFFEPGYDISGFDTITVPGHMELAGYGQIQYTNTAYPWDGHKFLRPPQVDWDDAPVGSYVREFDLDANLRGKRVCLSFQGAEQAVFVWLNGAFVGYGEDSFTPSDFDVTELVKPEGNRLCVECYKRCSASWIEDQDFFRFSGIFREVFLYAKPESHIEDLDVTADWNEDTMKRNFTFNAAISGSGWQKLTWELSDKGGSTVLSGQLSKDKAEVDSGIARALSGKITVASAQPWNVGAPYLYNLTLKLYNAQDELIEIVPNSIGFRHFEIKNNVMLLNGKRLVVNGVNRHEWSPYTGRAIGEDEMRRDIATMKKNGINAVRTSHYPNQSLWYELCDEAGICVLDETNLESHGTCMKLGITETSWNIPGSDMRWAGCCLDRARSMVERDKNHPSILWWSAGNESHVGDVIALMCEYFHTADPTRLVHYEAVFYDRTYDYITDVESRMYPQPDKVREYLENDPPKPMMLCEYMHDMGNSMGGLESYRKLMDEFESFQGGFLWDFIDQAIYPKNADGTYSNELLYGGDFCDRPTDYAFCANGLMFADRTEKPAMDEVRYWYLPEEERAAFDLKNAAERGQAEKRAAAELTRFSPANGDAALYHVPTGPQGSSGTPENEQLKEKAVHERFLDVVHTDFNLGVKGEGFAYIFSFDKGGPTSLRVNGKEQLYRAPRPTFWRAPTENDLGCGFNNASAQWLGADMYSTAKECAVEEFGDNFAETLVPLNFKERKPARPDIKEVEIRYTYVTATSPQTTATVVYRVNAYGKIKVTVSYKGCASLPDLPAFGLTLTTPAPLAYYSWEGLSGETYPDRYKGAEFGTYTAEPQIPAYLVPQECGNHTRTVRMTAGELVFITDEKPFDFSVLPYTPQELADALHREELVESRRSTIRILGAMRGVGGIDSWGSDVEPAYHVSGGQDISFAFHIIPKTSSTPADV